MELTKTEVPRGVVGELVKTAWFCDEMAKATIDAKHSAKLVTDVLPGVLGDPRYFPRTLGLEGSLLWQEPSHLLFIHRRYFARSTKR